MHMTPRTLRNDGHHSHLITAGNSILAGCTQANSFGRIVLYEVLETINLAHPNATLESYVDDLNQGSHGDKGIVVRDITRAAVDLKKHLEIKDLKISSKSVIMSSSADITTRVRHALSKMGIDIETDTQTRDLGVDTTVGGRRRLRTINTRHPRWNTCG